jgi:ribosome maturation factor RimP
MEIERDLQILLDEYFENSEYKIIETVFRGEKGTKVLEIFVDNKNGINIDEITGINNDLNGLIDNKLIINDISNLTVSSPGVDRAVRFLWQLYKHTGRILEIELNDGEKTEGKLTVLSENGDGNIEIEISIKEKGKKNRTEQRIINFKDIKEAKVKISFSKK